MTAASRRPLDQILTLVALEVPLLARLAERQLVDEPAGEGRFVGINPASQGKGRS